MILRVFYEITYILTLHFDEVITSSWFIFEKYEIIHLPTYLPVAYPGGIS